MSELDVIKVCVNDFAMQELQNQAPRICITEPVSVSQSNHIPNMRQIKSISVLNQKLGAVIKGYAARRIWNNVASIRASRILFRHLSQFQQMLIEDKTEAVRETNLEGKL